MSGVMNEKIKWSINRLPKTDVKGCIKFLSKTEIDKAHKFHRSFPQYSVTPLADLPNLAKMIGVKNINVKDESYRFGLNAFKVLGGSYAMGRYIAQKLGKDIGELDYTSITSADTKNKVGEITFFTATDGNHGRGVAWAARELSQKSVVFMPKGSSQVRLENIRKEGATATITDVNYDDAVRIATDEAAKISGGIVVQDTAWEGYTDIPAWIMQGYGTMASEALEQINKLGNRPTHIIVQAGVGSLAGAIQGFFASVYPENPPIVIVAEANKADCLYKSAEAGDGEPRFVTGDLYTMMAGLACGEPNIIGWEVLKNHSTAFVSCPDWVAAKGMRILGNPLRGDDRVLSGESGAVGAGLIYEIMTNPEYAALKADLKLDANSNVLMFSTEGDTDPDKYLDVVWQGANS